MNLDKLKEIFVPILKEMNIDLYELEWLSKEKTLQVVITNKENKVDLDACVLASEALGKALDEDDLIENEYTLEVCSPGAEREIKDINELKDLKGSYVLVKFKEPHKSFNEIKGEIIDTSENNVTIEYRDKAATRKAELELENISFARFSVRI